MANHTDDHDDHDELLHLLWAQIFVAILSLVIGLISAISNILLLLTLHKDPLKCFRRRATTVFIQGLALSDFLTGSFVQTLYSINLMLEAAGHKIQVLYDIVSIGSHVGTKISILTLVVLAVDRLLAITLPWKYNTIVTRKRSTATNIVIWIFIATFEATHLESSVEKVLHNIDLHLQTTVPIVGLLIIFLATYLAFRKYSRNAVFAQNDNRSNRVHMRNLQFEKKIMVTILLIMIVVLASLTPYFIVEKIAQGCNGAHHGHEEHEERGQESFNCTENEELSTAKIFSVCLLSLSCALNPILYAWRIPHYRQSLKMVVGAASWRRRGSVGDLVPEAHIPSMFRLTDGISQEERETVLARTTRPRSNTNVQYVKPLE